MLSIWPTHHSYALKELTYSISNENMLVGDINLDGSINVLDVVVLVNLILSGEVLETADINQDNSVNVLDVVTLVNLILGD